MVKPAVRAVPAQAPPLVRPPQRLALRRRTHSALFLRRTAGPVSTCKPSDYGRWRLAAGPIRLGFSGICKRVNLMPPRTDASATQFENLEVFRADHLGGRLVRKLRSMKQKYEGKDLQSLVELGREQGYLTFDQVNDFLPQDVSSPTDLRSALESFQDMDIKVLADVPADGTDGEAEVKEGPDETAEPAPAADSISESSDPVRLYLREMGNFQLLSREQEVEIAKRIEAGENEVEEELLRSPVTLDFVIEMGARVEAGEGDLRDIFEENQEPADDDEERGPEADEKQLKKLFTATTKLKSLQRRIEDI